MRNLVFIFLMGIVSFSYSQQQKNNQITTQKVEVTPTGDTIVRTHSAIYAKNIKMSRIKKQDSVITPTFKYVPSTTQKQRMVPVNGKKEIITHTMRYEPGKVEKDTIKK